MGGGGSSSTRVRYWPHGFSCAQALGGKKWPPAITFPQMRQGLAMILHEALQCGTQLHMLEECQKRLPRKELARFYPWK
jgi:hypothetical protein